MFHELYDVFDTLQYKKNHFIDYEKNKNNYIYQQITQHYLTKYGYFFFQFS